MKHKKDSLAVPSRAKKFLIAAISAIIAVALVLTCALCFTQQAKRVGVNNEVNGGAQPSRTLSANLKGDQTAFGALLNGDIIDFTYNGSVRYITLPKGTYTLEVWGAQGGNSAGCGTGSYANVPRGKGGLGGYSVGQITLSEKTKFFIYVGGEGKSAQAGDGTDTAGSFPDGGGTKTGHYDDSTSVPGTGGGSTSIRAKSDSLYSRVIVAGGGGGAGGDRNCTDHGGFGGGASGGNSYACGSLRDRGAGTQTGSTPGPKGSGTEGVAGTFGQGATGLYHTGRDSGGGGGGGSGGYGGNTNCASGGGGSGWIFTEESFSAWKSGDSQNAGRFELDSSFYLSDARTVPGNALFPDTSGSGSETGHSGNGFAKITAI